MVARQSLAEWLLEKDIKRYEFADMIEMSPSYVTQLCDGTIWPGRDVVEKIIKVTKGAITADSFITPPRKAAS